MVADRRGLAPPLHARLNTSAMGLLLIRLLGGIL
jgi:hypothetical protein